MPLSFMKPGQTQMIQKINGKDETKKHLETLGFVVGEQVTVISTLAGNVILDIKGSRIALDRSMANRIIV